MSEFDSGKRGIVNNFLINSAEKAGRSALVVAATSSILDRLASRKITRREAAGATGLAIISLYVSARLIQAIWTGEKVEATKEKPTPVEKIILHDQTDPSWRFDDSWDPDFTCGPTVLSMVLSSFGESTNPAVIDRIFQDKGFREGRYGSTMFRNLPGYPDVLSWLREEKKYQVVRVFDKAKFLNDASRDFDFDRAQTLLQQGYLIVASGVVNWIDKFPQGADHIFGIKAVDTEKGTFTIFDPWGGEEKAHSLSELKQFIYAYAIKPTQEISSGYYDIINLKDLSSRKTAEGDQKLRQEAKRVMNLTPQENYYDRGTGKRIQADKHIRRNEEVKLMVELKKKNAPASEVIQAIEMSATVDGRAYGMQFLWQKRQNGQLKEFGLYPLSKARIKWALDNNIDPRVLAIAKDVAPMIKKLLEVAPEIFFEVSENRQNIDTDDVLPNPGLMAKLMQQETGISEDDPEAIRRFWGLVNMGQGLSYQEINKSNAAFYASGNEDLDWITNTLQQATGLPYYDNRANTPGSFWADKDSRTNQGLPENRRQGSGGAIGPQIMPINIRLFMEKYSRAKEKLEPSLRSRYPDILNPFNPFSAMMLVYLFLSSEVYKVHGNVNNKLELVKPGYKASDSVENKIAVLRSWNDDPNQARAALGAGLDYYSSFGRN